MAGPLFASRACHNGRGPKVTKRATVNRRDIAQTAAAAVAICAVLVL